MLACFSAGHQSDDVLRRELATFCDDPKWIEEMITLKGH